MAGDWLKVEVCTPDKPEVIGIADMLGIAPAHAFGSLFMVWRWFDQHTTEGNASYVTKVTIDRLSGNAGFADAMSKVGWLTINNDGTVALPHFDRHNGETAKQRGLTAKRVAKSKSKSNDTGNAPIVTTPVTTALPKEEKRIEDLKSKPVKDKSTALIAPDYVFPEIQDRQIVTDWLAIRKAKDAPATKTALEGVAREARKAGMQIEDAIRMCCERNWSGFKASWLENDGKAPVGMTYHEKLADTAEQIFGRKHGTGNQIIDITPKQATGSDPENIPAVYAGLRA